MEYKSLTQGECEAEHLSVEKRLEWSKEESKRKDKCQIQPF